MTNIVAILQLLQYIAIIAIIYYCTFSILQYIIAAKKLQYYCNILQKYVSIRVYRDIVGEVYIHIYNNNNNNNNDNNE